MDIIQKYREYEAQAQRLREQIQAREENEKDKSYYTLVGQRNIYMDFALGLWHLSRQHYHPSEWPARLAGRLKREAGRAERYHREIKEGIWHDDVCYQWIILARAAQINHLIGELEEGAMTS